MQAEKFLHQQIKFIKKSDNTKIPLYWQLKFRSSRSARSKLETFPVFI